MEEWRQIAGYKQKVSNFGSVLGVKGEILNPNITRKGYIRIALSRGRNFFGS